MENTYDFFGGPLHGKKERRDTAVFPMTVEGGTYRLTGTGHAVGDQPMVYIALFWPDREATERDNAALPVKVGDLFPLGTAHVGDCDGEKQDGTGVFTAYCALDAGHSPAPHVATDGRVVVEVWQD